MQKKKRNSVFLLRYVQNELDMTWRPQAKN
jgi:hypothetical protein